MSTLGKQSPIEYNEYTNVQLQLILLRMCFWFIGFFFKLRCKIYEVRLTETLKEIFWFNLKEKLAAISALRAFQRST